MRLEQQHPSLAHLTFVAAIEGFGARFVSDAPCDCSPGCTHQQNVGQKRFRKALKTVMTNREVEKIWETAYTLRFFTGHSGSLFGSERTYGYSHYGSLFDTAEDAVFDYVILGQLRNTSRLVIAKGIADPADPGGSALMSVRAVMPHAGAIAARPAPSPVLGDGPHVQPPIGHQKPRA
jgi:hypothetical protein